MALEYFIFTQWHRLHYTYMLYLMRTAWCLHVKIWWCVALINFKNAHCFDIFMYFLLNSIELNCMLCLLYRLFCLTYSSYQMFSCSIYSMDQDKSLNISYDEWRDFLLLAPSSDLHDILRFWRHSTVSQNMVAHLNVYMIFEQFALKRWIEIIWQIIRFVPFW